MGAVAGLLGVGSSAATTGIAAAQNADAMMTEGETAAETSEARKQAVLSIATKQADAQTSRNAKQSEAMAQI